MPPRKYNKMDPKVQENTPENLRIEIDQIFRDFLNSDEMDHTFPSDLNNLQRKYIHEKAKNMNLISKSYGKEPNRRLRICKKSLSVNHQTFYISLTKQSVNYIESLLMSNVPKPTPSIKKSDPNNERNFGKLSMGLLYKVPEAKTPPHLLEFKKSLPIFDMREQITEIIRSNQIIIISSETGSGKSTQIPQFLMEDSLERDVECKIVCAQPRRISAVAVAERVAEERGEALGDVVGYHIRLESKLAPHSNLIYVTNGVLVRTVMSGEEALNPYTHIIIDEVHERDKLSDFLLICLRQYLKTNSKLKLILMSATVNISKFLEYFEDVKVIQVPGRLFSIQEHFLDDILPMLQYKSRGMERKLEEMSLNGTKSPELVESQFTKSSPQIELDVVIKEEMDSAIEAVVKHNDLDSWSQIRMHLMAQEAPVDYQHSQTGFTALMAASYHGQTDFMEELLQLGATCQVRCNSGHTALELATKNKQLDAVCIINHFMNQQLQSDPQAQTSSSNYDVKKHLMAYDMTIFDDFIDYDIIIDLIQYIDSNYGPGAILVFLPGYDDIMICNDRIVDSGLSRDSYRIFYLHGSMSIGDQHEVFKPMPKHKRKIILSTNIAETSLTINDVVFVIDSGKAKEKSYDAFSGMGALQTQWISKACIKQRTGRAGRTSEGFCFHVYSKQRFNSFAEERTPEILRVPLEELCLHTKTIVKNEVRIEEFLEQAPNPPSSNTIKVAVESLQALGALDDNEELTPLGEYLEVLTIEPHLGKMLIYAVVFKCLDPILTLVASLAYKDPFQLPPQANLRTKASERRKSLTDNVLSDHLIFLKAFNTWQDHWPHRYREFCSNYFINSSTLEMILQTRSQLLGQLRASGLVSQGQHSIGELNCYSNNWPMVKAVISCGLYPKIAFPIGATLQTRSEKKVSIHQNSCLYKLHVNYVWLMYDELVKVRQNAQIRGVTAITPVTVPLICGNTCTSYADGMLNIDSWMDFELAFSELFVRFREILTGIVKKVLRNPSHKLSHFDNKAIDIFNTVLMLEEETSQLKQATRFGQRPKFTEMKKRQHSGYSNLNQGALPRNTENGHNPMRYNRHNSHEPRQKQTKQQSYRPITKNRYDSQNNDNYSHHNTNEYNNGGFFNRNGSFSSNNSSGNSMTMYPTVETFQGGYVNELEASVNDNDLARSGFSSRFGSTSPHCDPSGIYVVIKSQKLCNVWMAEKTREWICSPSTEKFIVESLARGSPVYLVFIVPSDNKLAGIALVKNFKFRDEGRNKAQLDWVFSDSLALHECPYFINWTTQKSSSLNHIDGMILDPPVVSQIYAVFSSKGIFPRY